MANTNQTKKRRKTKNQKMMNDLASIVDDSTTTVYIPTPKGWKCSKTGCDTKYKHIHSTFFTTK